MANGKEVDVRTPPYLPFANFKRFVGSFSGGVLPPRIDRSLMPRMSGADQSYMRTAMRFFGLVDAEKNDAVTERFKKLVAASGTDGWKGALRSVVEEGYADIVAGLDLNATSGQLDERFREKGKLQGSALVRAVRFYLAAADEAGIEVSPHFQTRVSSPATGASPRRRRAREERSSEPADSVEQKSGTKELRFTFPSGEVRIWIPEAISLKELEKLAAYVKDYHELSEGTE